jgi:hypothetical protein
MWAEVIRYDINRVHISRDDKLYKQEMFHNRHGAIRKDPDDGEDRAFIVKPVNFCRTMLIVKDIEFPLWKKAMEEELECLNKRNTFTIKIRSNKVDVLPTC